MDDWLRTLPIPEDKLGAVESLCADTPAALLGLIQAARSDVARLIGRDTTELEHALDAMIGPEERAWLAAPPPQMSLGANDPADLEHYENPPFGPGPEDAGRLDRRSLADPNDRGFDD